MSPRHERLVWQIMAFMTFCTIACVILGTAHGL